MADCVKSKFHGPDRVSFSFFLRIQHLKLQKKSGLIWFDFMAYQPLKII